jgi:hypothetical protein
MEGKFFEIGQRGPDGEVAFITSPFRQGSMIDPISVRGIARRCQKFFEFVLKAKLAIKISLHSWQRCSSLGKF